MIWSGKIGESEKIKLNNNFEKFKDIYIYIFVGVCFLFFVSCIIS